MPPLLLKLIFDRIETGPMPFFVRPIARAIAHTAKNAIVHAEPQAPARLTWKASSGRSEWFAGPAFSAADIQMSFPLEAASVRGGLDESRPKLWAFLQEDPCAARLPARAGKRRQVRVAALTLDLRQSHAAPPCDNPPMSQPIYLTQDIRRIEQASRQRRRRSWSARAPRRRNWRRRCSPTRARTS